jgi:hypothetical protein
MKCWTPKSQGGDAGQDLEHMRDEKDHEPKPTSQTTIIVFAAVIFFVMAALAAWFLVTGVFGGEGF